MAEITPDAGEAPQVSFATAVTLAVWGALAGAHAELATRGVLLATRPALGSSFHFNPLAIGIGPIVNLPLFVVAVAIAWLIGRNLRPPRVFATIVFVVSALVAFEVAMVTRRVHLAALALLAVGCASVATRVAVRVPAWSLRLIRASAVVMAIVAIVGGTLLAVRPSVEENRALRSIAAPADDPPNVVLLILDTVRATELGLYGNPRPVSPNLDSLARNAIRYEFAYTTAPWTLPSHTTMLTGRYAHEFSSNWTQPYDGAHPTVTQLLRDRGYATGAFVGNVVYLNRRWGLNRGFVRYEDYQLDATVSWTTSSLMQLVVGGLKNDSRRGVFTKGADARVLRARFARWQRSIGDRPFFAMINLFEAHAPYGARAPYDTMFIGRLPRFYDINALRPRDKAEHEELQAGYDQGIAWVDAQVGLLLDDLRQSGVLDRTLLIITSDHGEAFGEHGYSGHGGGVHSTQSRVPLLIVPPGWRGSLNVDAPVSLRDLAATIVEATRLPAGSLPGVSLSRHWTRTRADGAASSPILVEVAEYSRLTDWYPSSGGSLQSVVADGMAYTVQEGGREWLYDLALDPQEQVDVSKDPSYADRLSRLRDALRAARTSATNPTSATRP